MGESVTVTIFNQPYTLRSNDPDSSEHVERLARLVDAKMQQVASQMTSHDISKIAILTALNLADELSRLKEEYQPEAEKTENVAKPVADEPQTWFDAIFDSPSTPQAKGERLSSHVAARLKANRSDNDDAGARTPVGEQTKS